MLKKEKLDSIKYFFQRCFNNFGLNKGNLTNSCFRVSFVCPLGSRKLNLVTS